MTGPVNPYLNSRPGTKNYGPRGHYKTRAPYTTRTTPDNIRELIARNPQSEEMRAYIIKAAVEYDMADEIPDHWTVALKQDEYDDTQDLIADQYKLEVTTESMIVTMAINAHESGAISFTIEPSMEPIVKFDIPTADRLLEMFRTIEYSKTFTQPEFAVNEPLIEPTTGIRYDPRGIYGNLTIPNDHGGADVVIVFNDPDSMVEGLSAMANSAEAYGTSEEIQE